MRVTPCPNCGAIPRLGQRPLSCCRGLPMAADFNEPLERPADGRQAAVRRRARPRRNGHVAALLALGLGWAGAHCFYLRSPLQGLIRLAVTAVAIWFLGGFAAVVLAWGVVDFLRLLKERVTHDGAGIPLETPEDARRLASKGR